MTPRRALALLIVCAAVPACVTIGVRRTAEPLLRFVKVDEGLYRGGQPSPKGIRQLAGMGIRTIVDLRCHSKEMDEERRVAEQLGMRWVNIPVWAWGRPGQAQMEQFLAIAIDPAQRPVFVHCRLGRNRTGVMGAIYRMAHDGWTPKQAYVEARRLGLSRLNLVSRHAILHKR